MIADSKREMKGTLGSSEFPMPVYYWGKFIGLVPFTLENNRLYPATLPGKLYSTTLVVVQLFLTSMMIFEQLEFGANATSASIMTRFVVYVIPDCVSIIFLTIGEKALDLLNEMCITSEEMKSLDIVDDYGKIFEDIFATTLTANILVGTTIFSVNYFNFSQPLLSSIAYLIKSLINLNTVLIFTQILIFVRQRFALVNQKLCDGIEPSHQNEQLGESAISRTSKNPLEENQPESEKTLADIERIEMIGALHSKLCDLVDKTTQLFAGPILLSTLQHGCMLLVFSYSIYSSLLTVVQISDEGYVVSVKRRILGLVLLTTIAIVQLFFVAHVSASTCSQGNAAKVMLFKIWNRFPLPELKNEFGMISIQMLQKSVTVSAFGFFDLGYSCPCKIFGTVVAYLIIMIQCDGTRPNRHIT